jgi:tyrosyl-tRNA synthetase
MTPFERIKLGTAQIIPEDELQEKVRSGRTLRVKLGLDPTAPDLHLGHAVTLRKLRDFQDLGHDAIFLVGDFTARIGDPTGRSKTRPALSEQEIAHNMQTYLAQAGKVLDASKIIIRYNSEWLDKLSCKQFVQLCGQVTLSRIIEREDFSKRFAEHVPIGFHELLYPLMQGYDSVALEADVELGGTDQTFNLLMGRYLQEHYGQTPQAIITMPLLLGLDGVQKMSKSLGNAIGIAEPADQAYGKLMSISDELMWHYFERLLRKSNSEISALQQAVVSGQPHPMQLKKQMAHDVIALYWSKPQADQAQQDFEALFQKQDYSRAQAVSLPEGTENPIWVVDLIKLLGAIKTSSEAKRLLEEGAVEVDGQKILEFKAQVAWRTGTIVKVGKHRIYSIE